jgi:hypothetical protein
MEAIDARPANIVIIITRTDEIRKLGLVINRQIAATKAMIKRIRSRKMTATIIKSAPSVPFSSATRGTLIAIKKGTIEIAICIIPAIVGYILGLCHLLRNSLAVFLQGCH